MRDTFPAQRTIGQIDIADITIDVVRSRDDIPLILLGLQHLYCTYGLREKAFDIIKEILPTQLVDGQAKPVSAESGCPGDEPVDHSGAGLPAPVSERRF